MSKRHEPDANEASFITHLLELRNRLLYAVIAVLVVFVALVPFSRDLYELIARPMMLALPLGTSMIATEVASPFLTPLKLTLALALVLALPMVLYQLWAFIAPGLFKHERKLVSPLVISSVLLFYAGMAFAYYVVFPIVFGFFTRVAPEGVEVMTDIRAYLDFIFSMFFAFGVAFEVPVAVVLLVKAGVITPESLSAKRPYVIVWAFVLSMLLTPPDIFSQSLLAIPMLVLFEAGLFIAYRIHTDEPETETE